MPNEVRILVRVQNSGKAGLNEVDKDVDAYAKKFSETFSKRFAESITKNLTETVTQHLRTVADQSGDVGDRIGDTIGRRMSTRITERIRNVFNTTNRSSSGGLADRDKVNVDVHDKNRERVSVDVDVDRQSFLQKITSLGKDAGDKIGGGITAGITSIFSGDVISTVIKGAVISLGTAVIAPALGAAISAGILLALGGGAIGAGVYSAIKNNRQIQAGFKSLAGMAQDEFKSFGENFTGPVANFAENLLGVFKQMKPQIDDLGKSLGPVADKLGDGVIGFLQNILPSIVRGMKAAEPLIEKLAEKLPGLGDDIGRFFDHISNSSPGATEFLGDLIEAIGLAIRLLGNFIEGLATMYHWARTTTLQIAALFADMALNILGAIGDAFGWIPGLGPKLQAAGNKVAGFSKKVHDELNKIPDVTINVRFRIVGQAAANAAVRTARILNSLGYEHGGIKGAASGGGRSGLTWVGESGPELVDLPAGSRVNTAGDSARMMAGSGAGQTKLVGTIEVNRTTERGVIDALVKMLRIEIQNGYGGNVQMALGS